MLKVNASLKSIDLLKNEIGDEGFKAIKIAFEGNEHLKSVCGIKEMEKKFSYNFKTCRWKIIGIRLSSPPR